MIVYEVLDMVKKRIVFMGTPEFAVSLLQRMLSEKYSVIGVVTQPDKPVGRKRELLPTPVKALAIAYDIPVFQPKSLKTDFQVILEWQPDLIITCAYGQMVPQEILEYPTFGCINIHASLLPKLRGGAPIHKAIMFGEKETGITIMKMAKKMDSGAICEQSKISIALEDTTGTLSKKLQKVAGDLLISTLPKIFSGEAVFIPQNEHQVTYAYNISKEEEFISFNRPYEVVYNHIRSLIPIPIGFGIIDDKKYKFHEISYSMDESMGRNGEVIGFKNDAIAISVAGKLLYIKELQLEGKQKTSAKDFYNGHGKEIVGKVFL